MKILDAIYLRILVASSVPWMVTSKEVTFQTITFPAEFRTVTAKVLVNSTTCSVTCGLGYKDDVVCLILPDGSKTNCEVRRQSCLTNWVCGLQTFTVAVGSPFKISCFTTIVFGTGSQSLLYNWRVARGIITTDDALFKPFKTKNYTIRFDPAVEKDAGTYRCDVQLVVNLKLIKRVYFGVKIISKKLVNLDFEKFLTSKEKLEALAAAEEVKPKDREVKKDIPWQTKALYVCLIGGGSGFLAALIVGLILYFLFLKKQSILEEQED
ncbi:transmembrane protein 81 [Microcaecilia unicolor]|uniref:Transmembrane protein 81 n=1 Tax=Microcaecilia unicolor TaxID=1415580 RepID=A0A6P7ZV63_9AMPH|nr:transmembrane protein 81 [Microcaecilia unicolor]